MTQPPRLSHPAPLLFAVQHCIVPRRGINKNLGFVPLQCVWLLAEEITRVIFVGRMALLFFNDTHDKPLVTPHLIPGCSAYTDAQRLWRWSLSLGPTEDESLRFQALNLAHPSCQAPTGRPEPSATRKPHLAPESHRKSSPLRQLRRRLLMKCGGYWNDWDAPHALRWSGCQSNIEAAVTTVTQRRHASYPALKTTTGGFAQRCCQQKLSIFLRWVFYSTTGHLMILIRRGEQTPMRCFLLHSIVTLFALTVVSLHPRRSPVCKITQTCMQGFKLLPYHFFFLIFFFYVVVREARSKTWNHRGKTTDKYRKWLQVEAA